MVTIIVSISMKAFSLDHLNATEFEEFCYDLLEALGARKLNWRKGTGFLSSPSDQGRDIECYFERKDVDGHSSERWFVDAKHYKQGVPPEKLQSLLSWATAERPNVALIVTSNFLSNSAKISLETYERSNHPFFKIKIWERPDLERFVLGKPLLMRKYDLGGKFEFLNILHPAHVEYLHHPPINTADYFFNLLDGLEHGERSEFFMGSFIRIINPSLDQVVDPKRQALGDLIRGKVDYVNFRDKIYSLSSRIELSFLIQSIILYELSSHFMSADKTSVQEVRERLEWSIKFFEEKLKRPHPDPETIKACIKSTKEDIDHLEERISENYERYTVFCEKVVVPLLNEKVPVPPELKRMIEEEEAYARRHKNASSEQDS